MEKRNRQLRMALGGIMVLIYLGMGTMLAFSNIFNINQTLRIIIGALFLLYGVFRGFRLWKSGY